MSKFKKLIKNPNRFFFDYFSKRIGREQINIPSGKSEYLIPPGYSFDEKIHPWVQIAKKFNLKTGAISGHPDQSLLADNRILLDLILYSMWIAHGFKSYFKIYTLGGGFETQISGNELLNPRKAELIYSKIHSKPDFVIEFIGEFDNNFAAHLFIYDVDPQGLFIVRSNLAFIKKSTTDAFEKIYPEVIDKFGNYEFGVPWPVDIVFTWVNKDDLDWQKMWNEIFPEQSFDPDRYSNRDEMRYSLRAISKFLPWFHKIHIVSNCNRPDWLKDHPKLNWVKHQEIFPDQSVLPTFNSHAIEACLHLIHGLSDSFIYFNDDMFVNRPCYYHDFFDDEGQSKPHLETHGSVFEGNLYDETREYLAPAINSQQLIKQEFPFYRATCLHKHTPYALNKKILEEIEHIFVNDITKTRAARLRSIEDINLPSFMYHHYALAAGKANLNVFPYIILRPSNVNKEVNSNIKHYKFICFNDGDGSAEDNKFTEEFNRYVDKEFPKRSSFELGDGRTFDRNTLSVCIMAYKTRAHRIPYIRSMLGDVLVSLDDGELGLYRNSRKSWLLHESSAVFHLVVQDDSLICKDFYNRIEKLISNPDTLLDRVYCLYFRLKGTKKKVFTDFNQNALDGLAKGFFIDKYLRFGIALIVPTYLINEMIEFADKLDNLGPHDDTRYSTFFSRRNIKVIYPLPSLVNQDPSLSSTHNSASNQNLQATWFVDGENGFKKYLNVIKDKIDTDSLVPLFYWEGNNFGDKISPYLTKKITGKATINIHNKKNVSGLLSVGSIIQQIDRKDMVIWGSGVMREYGEDISKKLSLFKPKKIAAVRGLKTRDYLVNKLGWSVPEVYGDPALLMPIFYTPIKREQGIVICPHYQHYEKFKIFINNFSLVDVKQDVEKVIDILSNASAVISTSLHGLIIAQAYEVPWVWLRIEDSVLRGGDFKFEDFFSTLNRDKVQVYNTTIEEIEGIDFNKVASIATLPELKINLQDLFDSFPQEFI